MSDTRGHITRRHLLAAAGAALMLPAERAAIAAPAGKAVRGPRVVVELFTSQGCSACPPADALMEELCRRPGVLGISYNIDIWDYLGWRDTLARPEFSRRQRMYARALGARRVYTPQMVINGHRQVVGNARAKVLAAIAEEMHGPGCQHVPMTLRPTPQTLEVEIGETPALAGRDATLWLISMRERVRVKIRHGENRGREITYHHVARRIMPAGMWHGRALRLSLPRAEIMTGHADMCAALLQLDTHGPVVAAAVL